MNWEVWITVEANPMQAEGEGPFPFAHRTANFTVYVNEAAGDDLEAGARAIVKGLAEAHKQALHAAGIRYGEPTDTSDALG